MPTKSAKTPKFAIFQVFGVYFLPKIGPEDDQDKNQEIIDQLILFSLVQVQNQSFGPKQNTKFTVNHQPPPPPTYQKLFEGF